MANNARGMNDLETVFTLANCLAGTRKLLYENIIADAIEDDRVNEEHAPKVYQDIKYRILMFTGTTGERQIRVQAE